MKAIVYHDAWNIEYGEAPEPGALDKNDVLVRICATGICGTDLGIVSGQYHATSGVILGHESAGYVVEAGSAVGNFRPNQRVVIDPTYYCGQCQMCRTGRQNHCIHKGHTETGVSSNGTFAEYYVTEERFLYKLADHVSYDEASLTEPLSCVLTGIGKVRLRSEFRTLVLGGGAMGLLYSYALAARGLSGGVVEIAEQRRKKAVDIVDGRWQVFKSLDEATDILSPHDRLFDLIVDTTGVLASASLSYLAHGGTLLLVGLRDQHGTFNPQSVTDHSLSIIGSIDSLGTFQTAHHLIETGVVPVRKLITHTSALVDFKMALKKLGCDLEQKKRSPNAEAIKVIIKP